ncbi:hypothetical protein [Halobacterium litoreum]|uniref:Uncharacterized protein n=1 Tax=Halobacterium litoreum TaxID=2039234 RepID=A0ABD5NG31_9EURY|nr:hypothetical protein [Halobacterium litoreum]UHH13099.1 hypothetical protein LT972_13175 [Halobacterium litoreum]
MSNDDHERRDGGQRENEAADERDHLADAQPHGGANRRPAGRQQPSVTDLLSEQATQNYAKTVAGVMAAVGVGIGVMVILLGSFGGSELGASLSTQQYKLGLTNTALGVAPYVGFAVAAGAGLLVGFSLGEQRRATVAAAAGSLVGAVLLFLLAEIIASTQVSQLSVDYGQALVNAVLMGVGTAIAGGAGAYFGDELA